MAGRSISPMLAFLLGVAVVGLGVLAYLLTSGSTERC